MSATLLQFPTPEGPGRSCWDCKQYAMGAERSICMFFNEAILDERESASDCPVYDPIEES